MHFCALIWKHIGINQYIKREKKMKNNKEIKMPSFHKTVNVDKINTFSLKELRALDKLLDGKATKKDYQILRGKNER
jgi:hypothetical protein